VIVLVYATWCPKCNSWSGELFQQLKETSATRPVVILAINTDESPRGVQEYLAQRGFFGPNIFHGYDPLLPKRLGLQSNLFQAAIITPDGRAAGMRYAGTLSNTPAGRRFTLAEMISQSAELGQFRFISPDMSPEAAQLLWPLELDTFSETALRRVQARLSDEDKAKLEEAIEKFLDARLAEIRELYYGELADKLRAYDLSVELAKMFRNREQCVTARRVVAALESQPGFKRELAAKRSYEKMWQSAQARPDQRASLLFRVARAFEGTYYGELARREAEAARNQLLETARSRPCRSLRLNRPSGPNHRQMRRCRTPLVWSRPARRTTCSNWPTTLLRTAPIQTVPGRQSPSLRHPSPNGIARAPAASARALSLWRSFSAGWLPAGCFPATWSGDRG